MSTKSENGNAFLAALAASDAAAQKQKRDYFQRVLPTLLKRLSETDKLLGQAGPNLASVISQRELNHSAVCGGLIDPECVLARLQESDRLLWKIKPTNRRDRLRLAILSQSDRNDRAISLVIE